MSKRIAYIGLKGLPAQAGVDRVVEAIVRRVDRQLYQPVAYVSSKVVPKGTVVPGIELIRVPTLPGKFSNATVLYLLAALHAVCFGNYALVHLHNVEASFILPLLRLRYKVISTSHGATQWRDKWGWLPKLLFTLSEIPFIYLSNAITCVAEPLTARYERLYHRRVHFIANGVEEELLDLEGAAAVLQEHNLTSGHFLMFAAGRIIGTKGCHTLLEAYRSIKTDLPLIIVGNLAHIPEYEAKLRAMADERVHFISFLPSRLTVLGLARHAQLFVFPSTYEGMSMMLLEIVALDVPLLSSDIPENTKVLPAEALLFKADDVQDLRDKLEWALHHRAQMTEAASKTYAHVWQLYDWDNLVKEYEALYATLS